VWVHFLYIGFPFVEPFSLTPCYFELRLFFKVQLTQGKWKTPNSKALKSRHFVFNLLLLGNY
jgi:hypothetical protein